MLVYQVDNEVRKQNTQSQQNNAYNYYQNISKNNDWRDSTGLPLLFVQFILNKFGFCFGPLKFMKEAH